VENVYQRRLDLVPLLVDAVQTYTDHERETLTELTAARAGARVDVPCRQTVIRRNRVELFLTVTPSVDCVLCVSCLIFL
ncbi:MAG: LemA family protein, partial [Desulfobacterales bacterium]